MGIRSWEMLHALVRGTGDEDVAEDLVAGYWDRARGRARGAAARPSPSSCGGTAGRTGSRACSTKPPIRVARTRRCSCG